MPVVYDSNNHRSSSVGYPNPINSQAMAKFVFKKLCQKNIKDFYLVGVDNSSTLLSSWLIMECHKSKRKNKPTPIFISGNKRAGGLKPSGSGFYPEDLPTVYLDDYYSVGEALKYVCAQIGNFSATESNPLLYVFLIGSKRTKEYISEKHSVSGITCEAEVLLASALIQDITR